MTILYVLVPVALLCGAGAVAAFLWAVRTGQLDDLETPPQRILADDEPSRGTSLAVAEQTKPLPLS